MQLPQPRLQIGDAAGCGLDHHLLLAVLLDLALPAIDRGHEWKDVDARRETLLDERPRDRRGVRRAVQYLLVFVGCVLVLDALVGEKGLLEMLKKRQEYRALEQSLVDVR